MVIEAARKAYKTAGTVVDKILIEQFNGAPIHVSGKDYPGVIKAVRKELEAKGIRKTHRRLSSQDNGITTSQREIAEQVVKRAQETAENLLEDFSRRKGSFIGKIPLLNRALVNNWYARQRFDAERIRFNNVGELLTEEIPFVGDVRSAFKGIAKLFGVKGWDGQRRRVLPGAIEDFIGVIPEVPENILESVIGKGLEEPSVIAWSGRRKNQEKLKKMATEIAVARQLTQIRHVSRLGSPIGGLVSKVIIGSSRA